MANFIDDDAAIVHAGERPIAEILLEWVSEAYTSGDKASCTLAIETLYAFYDGQCTNYSDTEGERPLDKHHTLSLGWKVLTNSENLEPEGRVKM